MIHLIQFLRHRKPLVILFLFFPLMGIFAENHFLFSFLPENPQARYQVTFKVPHRTSVEINTRVARVAEKIFNGLPGLVSLTSKTADEKADFDLLFSENISANNAYLFLQEKIDRIKLELPRDVESIEVELQKEPLQEDYQINLEKPQSVTELKQILLPIISNIKKSEPDLETQSQVYLNFDSEKLYKEQISISQAVQALKLTGLTIDMGRENGFLVRIGQGFSTVEDIKSLPIGVRGTRPILISDIANLEFRTPQQVQTLKLWLDTHSFLNRSVRNLLLDKNLNFQISQPYWDNILRQLYHPLIGIVFLALLQIVFFLKSFGRSLNLTVVAIYNGLIGLHFLFWRSLFFGRLTVLDIHALLMTLLIGTAVWIAIFARIRSFYLPHYRLNKIPKTSIEQATLYALGELLPTLIFLSIAMYLFNLPILQSGINLPSRFLIESLVYVGMPVLVVISIIMPILTDYEWILDASVNVKPVKRWQTNPIQNRIILWSFVSLAVFFPLFIRDLPLGVNSKVNSDLQTLRGYNSRLEYLLPLNEKNQKNQKSPQLSYTAKNLKKVYNVWEFTPSGMRFLPDLNLSTFSPSLSLLKSNNIFGYLENSPVRFNNLEFGDYFSDLLIAAKDSQKNARPIGVLAKSALEVQPSLILRNRMLTADFVTWPLEQEYANLKKQMTAEFIPTQETQYVQQEFKKFSMYHLTSIIFFILVVSIYLNSFYRAAIITLLVASIQSFVFFLYYLTNRSFHVDSLWFAYLPTWFCLFYYSFIARIIDLERERGHDRDEAALEVQAQYMPTINYSLIAIYVVLITMSLVEVFLNLPRLGIWQESLICTTVAIVFTWLLNRSVIPVLYLNSEEYLDKQLYKLLKLPVVKQVMQRILG